MARIWDFMVYHITRFFEWFVTVTGFDKYYSNLWEKRFVYSVAFIAMSYIVISGWANFLMNPEQYANDDLAFDALMRLIAGTILYIFLAIIELLYIINYFKEEE